MFFHNLSAHDCHLFIKELPSIDGDINIIPLNQEQYISIWKKFYIIEKKEIELRFLDSFKFMPSSLQSPADNLSETNLFTIKSFFTNIKEFNLIRRKAVFLYDYLSSVGSKKH